MLKNKPFRYFFLTLILLTCLQTFAFIFLQSFLTIKIFSIHKGRPNSIRQKYYSYASSIEAKKYIPPHSKIQISPNKLSIEKIARRYFLYPLEISKQWSYFIDFDHNFKETSKSLSKYQTYSGTLIYSQPNHKLLSKNNSPKEYSTIRALLIFTAITLFQIYCGFLILKICSINHTQLGASWHISTSYLLGVLYVNILLWVFLLFKGSLNQTNLLLLEGAGITLLFIFSQLKKNIYPAKKLLNITTLTPNTITKTLFLPTFLIIGSIVIMIALSPVIDWDAMSHWIMKAKVIYQHKQLDFHYTHYNFYPILWPLNIALQFTFLSETFDQVAQWSSALLFLTIIIQLFSGLKFLKLPEKSIWVCLLLFITFFFSIHPHISSMAENILTAYLTAALTAIILWIKSNKNLPYIILAILLALGICLTKFEGSFISLFIGFALLTLIPIMSYTKKHYFLISLFFFIILTPILWMFWISSHHYMHNIVHMSSAFTFKKLFYLLHLHIITFLQSKNLTLFFGAFVYLYLYKNNRKWNPLELFLLIVAALLTLFSVFANMGLPIERLDKAVPEAGPRLFLHASTAITLLWGSRAFVRNE